MKILVLLTCYNRKEKTINCINSLIKEKGIKWKFIIVDDQSTDGTPEALKKFEEVEIINGNGKCFYSGGMRIAIKTAKEYSLDTFDYIMLINDDVVFHDDAVLKLIDYLNGDKAIMIGATNDDKGNLSYGGVILKSKFKPKYDIVMSTKSRLSCDTFNANCVLIPKDIFIKLDNIDQTYEHAMGDYDYGLVAHDNGINIYVSNFFVGKCNDNTIDGTWRDKNLDRIKRYKLKETTKGLPFKQWFYYLYKNHGLLVAIVYSIIPYIKIILGQNS